MIIILIDGLQNFTYLWLLIILESTDQSKESASALSLEESLDSEVLIFRLIISSLGVKSHDSLIDGCVVIAVHDEIISSIFPFADEELRVICDRCK